MTSARASHDGSGLLRQGLALLDAQRTAMIAGELDELARINAALAEWIARMPRTGADPLPRDEAVRMSGALRANAAVAQRAAASAQRGFTALLAPVDPLYEADGRTAPATSRRRGPLSA